MPNNCMQDCALIKSVYICFCKQGYRLENLVMCDGKLNRLLHPVLVYTCILITYLYEQT